MTKLAVITGASGGLGSALARLLALKKTPLLLTGRDELHLQALKEELQHLVPIECIRVDLSREIAILLDAIEKKEPDLLIHCAGFGTYGPLVNELHLGEMIDVNVKAAALITQKMAQTLLRAQKPGIILNVSSAASFFSIPYFASYAASKSFVRVFSESVDAELQSQGIRVLTSSIGQIDTLFSTKAAGNPFKRKMGYVISKEKAAQLLLKQIERKKRSQICDFRYCILMFLAFFLPKTWIEKRLGEEILFRHRK